MNSETKYINIEEKPPQPKKIRFSTFFYFSHTPPLSLALFFSHINSLINKIPKIPKIQNIHTSNYYLKSCALTPDEIFNDLDSKLNQNYLKKEECCFNQKRIASEFKKKFLWRFLLIGFLRFSANLLLFSGPIFLDLLTDNYKNYESNSNQSDLKIDNIIYSVSLACCFVIFSLLESQYSWALSKLEIDIKIYFQYLLYQKGLVAKAVEESGERNDKEEKNESKNQIANFTNLLTIDINSVLNFIQSFHQTWSQILNLFIGLVLLYIKMKSAIFLGFFAVCILVVVNFLVARKIGSIYERMMKHKDVRISLTQDVLMGVRQIKYLNWEPIFEKKILEIRQKEFQCLTVAKYLDALCVFFWAATTVVIYTLRFVAYDTLGEDVRKINVFTAISLFNILIFPLNALPWTIGGMLTGRVSFKRLMEFFSTPEVSKRLMLQDGNSENAIEIKNMSFIWPVQRNEENRRKSEEELNKAPFTLKNLRLEIKKGSLTMILGKIGSGKTALANAILREMESLNYLSKISVSSSDKENDSEYKDLVVNGSIAYVSQNSWLQNTTIKENILFGKKYDEKWYNFCIKSCELIPDLESFKNGDNHEVGSEGFCLSGGQKQRISLCRAMYQDSDIYILDDIFSSVDAEVATRIFENALIALQKKGKSILLILSQYRFIKYASQVLLLKNGELIQGAEDINEYIQNSTIFSDKDEKSSKPSIALNLPLNYNKDSDFFDSNIMETPVNCASPEGKELKQDERNTELSEMKAKINDETSKTQEKKEGNEEIREEGEIKIRTLMIYILGMGLVFFCLILLTMTMMQLCRNFFDIWLKEYVNYNTLFLIQDDFKLTLILIAVFTIFWTFMRAICFAVGNLRASKNIFIKLLHSIMYSKMAFFETNAIGRIINRFSGDTQAIDDRISFESNCLLNNVFILTGSLVVIIIQNIYVFISVALIWVLFYFIQKKYRHSSREIKRLDAVNYSSLLTHISETSNGVKIIRAHQKQDFFLETLKERLRNSNSSSFLISAISCWLSIRLQFLSTIITCSILLISMLLLLLDKNPDANSFALSLSYSLSITSLLRDLIMSLTSTERECISIERVNQYLHNQTELIEASKEKNKKKTKTNKVDKSEIDPLYNPPLESNVIVEFKNVWLKYDQSSDKYALKNLSFQIEKNQKVAFCGRTGCGKTSILNCLFRLYEIDQGEIFFQGNKLDHMSLHELRAKISVVPQLGFLFKGTIKENLDPSNEFEYDYIEHMISETKLDLKGLKEKKLGDQKSSSFASLNGSFLKEEFFVEAGGKNLSNGEKQIINFLRILLRNTEIVCLDEATSNLDPYTDEIINELIMKFSNKTLILITHRVHSLKFFDKIFVMNDGVICEQGTYNELKENPKSSFNLFAQHSDDN